MLIESPDSSGHRLPLDRPNTEPVDRSASPELDDENPGDSPDIGIGRREGKAFASSTNWSDVGQFVDGVESADQQIWAQAGPFNLVRLGGLLRFANLPGAGYTCFCLQITNRLTIYREAPDETGFDPAVCHE